MLDGKPVLVVAPNVPPGWMIAATAPDDHTIVTATREGILTGKNVRKEPADGPQVPQQLADFISNLPREPLSS
jgi:hypothetical protein